MYQLIINYEEFFPILSLTQIYLNILFG